MTGSSRPFRSSLSEDDARRQREWWGRWHVRAFDRLEQLERRGYGGHGPRCSL
ncbi:hypothetical protein [Streptomyces sp. NPDC088261]|uniref:hypothetical protein n=1 Tax=Streptomyces sp. NPDC088261 TaxID=3365851 RepID=UPI00382EBA10